MKFICKKSQFFSLKLITISFTYALILASLDMEYFRDRDNYLVYAIDAIKILENNFSLSILIGIFNEPLFLLFNHFLSFFFKPETILSIFVFIVSFILSYIVLKESNRNPIVLISLFILLPICFYTFHLQLVTIRQGLATSIFLYAVYKSDKFIVWLWTSLVCGFVHISFFIIFIALVLYKLFCGNKSSIYRIIFIQSIFSFVMSVGLIVIGRYLGIRQVNELSGYSINASGGFFIIWLFVFIYIIYLNKNKPLNKYYILSTIFLSIYLGSYFTNPTAGRLMGTFAPFIFITLGKMRAHLSIPLLLILFFIFLITFSNSISGGSLTVQFNLKDLFF